MPLGIQPLAPEQELSRRFFNKPVSELYPKPQQSQLIESVKAQQSTRAITALGTQLGPNELKDPTAVMRLKEEEQERTSVSSQLLEIAKLPNVTTASKLDLITSTFHRAGRPKDATEIFLNLTSTRALEAASSQGYTRQLGIDTYSDDLKEYYRQLDLELQGASIDFEPNEWLADDMGAAVITPFSYAEPLVSVINKVAPHIVTGPMDLLLPGSTRQDFIKWVKDQSVERQVEIARQISEEINNTEFLGASNDFIKSDLGMNLLNWEENSDFEKYLNDVFGVLDFLGFAGAARSGVKLLKNADAIQAFLGTKYRNVAARFARKARLREDPKSTMGMVNSVAPEEAKQLADKIIEDSTGDLAKSYGTDRATVAVETQLPKMASDDITPAPSSGAGSFSRFSGAMFSDNEIAVVESTLKRLIFSEELRPQLVKMAPDKVYLEVVEDGIRGLFHITPDDNGGFGSLKHAEIVAKSYENSAVNAGMSGFTTQILARDFKTNKYVPLEDISNYARTRTSKKADGTTSVITKNAKGAITARVDGVVDDTTATTSKIYSAPSDKDFGLVKNAYDRFIRKHLNAGLSVRSGKTITKEEYELLKSLEAEGYKIDFSKGLSFQDGKVSSLTGTPVATVLETAGKEGRFVEGYQQRLGDFMVQLKVDEKFHSGHSLAENPVLKTGVTGRFARWFDKGSWGTKWFVSGTNQAGDQFSARIRLLRETLQPLNKLSPDNQRKVYEALDEGDHLEKWWKHSELKDRWGEDPKFSELVEGYDAAVKHQHYVYEMINDATYRRLLGDGYRELSVKGERAIAQPLKSGEFVNRSNHINKIYDAELDKIRELTAADIAAIKSGEYQAAKFLRGKKEGFDEINYVIHARNKSKAKINPLPYNVINNNDGYITRIYDAAYVIRQPYSVQVDGSKIVANRFRVVGIERDLTSARTLQEQLIEEELNEKIKELTKAGKSVNIPRLRESIGKKHQLVRSNELSTTDDYYDPFNLEYLQDTGQLYTSPRRSKETTGMYETVKDPITGTVEQRARRNILSVSETIEQAQIKAAKSGTLDLAVDKLLKNWTALYEDKFGSFPFWRQVPEAAPDLKNADPDLIKEYKDAVAFADYIKMLGGFSESQMSKQVRKFMIETSENLLLNNRGNSWVAMLANGMVRARNLNVVDHLKAMAFFQLITMRPLRQAILQMNQMSLYLAHGDYGKYMLGEGAREFSGMWAGLAARSSGDFDKVKHTLARHMGMTTQEYEEVIDAYIRTGLPASVDSHVWVLGSRTERSAFGLAKGTTKTQDALYLADKGLSIAERAIRRYGFDLGEQTQLLAAFLAEKRAWQVANPNKSALWKQPRNLGEIAGMARNLSGNMNRTGALGFQQGVLGMAFQFMSHTSKMLQIVSVSEGKYGVTKVLSKWLGLNKIANKHIQDASKRRMLISQLLTYGTGGMGLTEGYEWLINENGWDVPQEVTSIVEEGLFGTAFNMALRVSEGKDLFDASTDLEVSRSLSPLGGSLFWTATNPITKLYDYLIDSPTAWHEMLGPGIDVLSRRLSGLPVLSHILMDASYLDNDERLEAFLVGAAGSLVLEADNWNKIRYEMAVRRYLSRKGNTLSNATNSEILIRTLLGPKTRASNRLSELETSLSGVYGGYRIEPDMSLTDLKAKAKSDMADIERVMILTGNGERTPEDLQKYVQTLAERSHAFMSERERNIYKTFIYKELRNAVTEDTQENRIIKHLLRIFPTMPDDPMQDMFYRIENAPDFEGKQEYMQGLRTMYYNRDN